MDYDLIKKEFKKNLMALIIYIIDNLFWWLPNDVYRGKLLLVMHVLSFVAVWTLFLMAPYPYTLISPAIFLIVLIQFYLLSGCIVTKAEIQFHKLDLTIIDPLLYILGVPITNKLRYDYTIIILVLSVVVMISTIKYRNQPFKI
jgi:hypothetical protein